MIGIKYCGGCNPRYDRVTLAEALKKKMGDKRFITGEQALSADLLIVVTGCQSRCPKISFSSNKILHIDKATPIDEIIERINDLESEAK